MNPYCPLLIILMIPVFLFGGLFGQWRMRVAQRRADHIREVDEPAK